MENLLYRLRQYAAVLTANRKRMQLTVAGIGISLFLAAAGEETLLNLLERQRAELRSFSADACIVKSEEPFDTGVLLREKEGAALRFSYCRYGNVPVRMTAERERLTIFCNLFPAGIALWKQPLMLPSENGRSYEQPLLTAGSLFTEEQSLESEPVCIIEESTSEILFGRADAVGEKLHFRAGEKDCELTVTGILRDLPDTAGENRGLLAAGLRSRFFPGREISTDRRILLPLSFFLSCGALSEGSGRTACVFSAAPEDGAGLSVTLRRFFKGADVYDYEDLCLDTEENTETVCRVLIFMRVLLTAAAGMMIMNTMQFYVRERSFEIGIRRALGACRADICREFVLQSVMLSIAAEGFAAATLVILVRCINLAAVFLPDPGLCLRLHPEVFFRMTAAAVCGSGAFSLPPAMRAAETDAAECMRRS